MVTIPRRRFNLQLSLYTGVEFFLPFYFLVCILFLQFCCRRGVICPTTSSKILCLSNADLHLVHGGEMLHA